MGYHPWGRKQLDMTERPNTYNLGYMFGKKSLHFLVECLMDSELSLHFSIISLNLHFRWQFFKYNLKTLLTI